MQLRSVGIPTIALVPLLEAHKSILHRSRIPLARELQHRSLHRGSKQQPIAFEGFDFADVVHLCYEVLFGLLVQIAPNLLGSTQHTLTQEGCIHKWLSPDGEVEVVGRLRVKTILDGLAGHLDKFSPNPTFGGVIGPQFEPGGYAHNSTSEGLQVGCEIVRGGVLTRRSLHGHILPQLPSAHIIQHGGCNVGHRFEPIGPLLGSAGEERGGLSVSRYGGVENGSE